MNLSVWLALASVCLLGAMTPGPSFALILKYTLNGGRRQGTVAGIFHGLAVGLYALATVLGLAAVIASSPTAFHVIQWSGAFFLLVLGIQGVRRKARPALPGADQRINSRHAARDGFLMACLNPYSAVFFLALFSQFIQADTPMATKLAYALTAMLIDMGWYATVAWLFSRPLWLTCLQRYSHWLERAFGLLLIGFAVKLVIGA